MIRRYLARRRALRKMRWAVQRVCNMHPMQRKLFQFDQMRRKVWRRQLTVDQKLLDLFFGHD